MKSIMANTDITPEFLVECELAADFMSLAPTALPALVAEVRRLQDELERTTVVRDSNARVAREQRARCADLERQLAHERHVLKGAIETLELLRQHTMYNAQWNGGDQELMAQACEQAEAALRGEVADA